jgi:Protein of unknown function (DUF3631)
MPDQIQDRNAEKWEPLFIVADVADVAVSWGPGARQAAIELLDDDKEIVPSLGVELLKDIFNIYNGSDKIINNRIATADLLNALYTVNEGPWISLYHGRGLDDRGLSRMLKPYGGISPKRIRIGDETLRGYDFGDFQDAWSRYLVPASPESATSATSATVGGDPTASTFVRNLAVAAVRVFWLTLTSSIYNIHTVVCMIYVAIHSATRYDRSDSDSRSGYHSD